MVFDTIRLRVALSIIATLYISDWFSSLLEIWWCSEWCPKLRLWSWQPYLPLNTMFLQATMDSKYLLLSGTQHVIEAKVYWITGFNTGQFLECYDFAITNTKWRTKKRYCKGVSDGKDCFGMNRITSLRLQH